MRKLKKYILILIVGLLSVFSVTAVPMMNFLPMEDGMSVMRQPIYGASIDNIKPFRQVLAADAPTTTSYALGIKDIWVGVLLVGVYIFFTRKRPDSRNVSF